MPVNGELTMNRRREAIVIKPKPSVGRVPMEVPLIKLEKGRHRFPWKLMKPGDHFFVPVKPDKLHLTIRDLTKQSEQPNWLLHSTLGTIRARQANPKYKSEEYMCIRAEKDGHDGVRVWRIK